MDILILLSLCLLSWRGIQGQHGHLPKEHKVMLGYKATLPCEAHSHDDSSTPTLQWLYEKDGNHILFTTGPRGTAIEESEMKSRIHINRNMQLVIEDVQIQDEKLFICRVEDQNGEAKESQAHLRVYKTPDDPEITMEQNGIQITDEIVQLGLCESRNGFPTPNITWYKNNTELKNGKDGVVILPQLTMMSNGLITVKSFLSGPVTKSDVYSVFYCDVTYLVPKGLFMKESEKKNITVDYPNNEVKLFLKSGSEMIKEGDVVELICLGDGNPQPEITLLRKDDNNILSEKLSYSWTVTRADSGGYVCKAIGMDIFNEMEAETELHVHYLDPPLLSHESPVSVELESVLGVSCLVNASAQTDIHWTRDGSIIANGSDLNLNIHDYTDAGQYSCVASVIGVPGLTRTKELKVIIKGRPQVTVTPQHVEVEDGKMLTVKCTAIGHPTPQITWYMNGSEVEGQVHNISDNEIVSELTFMVTEEHFDEQILCKAQNEMNSSIEYIHLQERTEPMKDPSTGSKATEEPVYTKGSGSTKEPPEPIIQKSYGVVIVAVIVCILLLAVLGAVLYFLYKKGRIPCGRSGTKDIVFPAYKTTPDFGEDFPGLKSRLIRQQICTKPGEKDHIVVEMKPDSPAEESVLLPGSQDKKQPVEQEKYMDLRN